MKTGKKKKKLKSILGRVGVRQFKQNFKIATLKSWKINIFQGANGKSGGLNASSEKLTWKNLGDSRERKRFLRGNLGG